MDSEFCYIKYETYTFTKEKNISYHGRNSNKINFILIKSGKIYFSISEQTYEIFTGEIVFINQGSNYIIDRASGEDIEIDILSVEPNFLFGTDQLELETKYIIPVLCNKKNFYIFKKAHEQYSEVNALLLSIIDNLTFKAPEYELNIKIALLTLWKNLLAIEEHAKRETKTSVKNRQKVEKAKEFVTSHYNIKITLDDIAKRVPIDKTELCRSFKKVLGITVFEYLNRYRIMMITQEMLCNQDIPLTEIVKQNGFNSMAYFNRTFKKIMNCTPTEYIKKANGN